MDSERPDHHIPEWYLEVEGAKTGPYTAEQILGLFEDGEILGRHRVTSARLKGEWIAVQDLRHALGEAVNEAHMPPSPPNFQPPPRPDMSKPLNMPADPSTKGPDPALSLFDALQAAREKKAAAKLTPPTQGEWGRPARRRKIPPQFWFLAALFLVVGISLWGMTKLVRTIVARRAADTMTSSVATSRANQMPSTAGAPPAPGGMNPGRPSFNSFSGNSFSGNHFQPNPTARPLRPEGGGAVRDEDDRRDDLRDRRDEPQDAVAPNPVTDNAPDTAAQPLGTPPLTPGQSLPGQPFPPAHGD